MATRFKPKNTTTFPLAPAPAGQYRDAWASSFTAGTTTGQVVTAPLPDGNRQLGTSTTQPQTFFSERLAEDVTISGTVTFNVWFSTPAAFTAKLLAVLSKLTSSGDVESEIARAETAQLSGTGSTLYNFTATATSTPMAAGERFVLRLYVTPISGSFGTGTPFWAFGNSTGGASGDTWFEVAQTFATRLNTQIMRPRRTAVNGIETFFDLLDTIGGSVSTTGVVNTSAGGNDIQWTRTAGGTLLHWISPRIKKPGWNFTTLSHIPTAHAWALESHTNANCALRVRLFHRSPAGVETLVYDKTMPSELTTTVGNQNLLSGTLTPKMFTEDDRLIMRLYLMGVTGMNGGHTCTVHYDHNVYNVSGDTRVEIVGGPAFKGEGDPPADPQRPTQIMMGGIG